MIVSEDDVTRRQIEEDLRLYGSRPEPPDTVEVDLSTQPANLPPKRNASDFETADERPAKLRKNGKSEESSYQALSVMDWNSGASPLDAWLNQSAVPSTTAALDQQESINPGIDLLTQEIDEIKVFHNVHMATAPSPEHNDPPLEPAEGLDFGTQIYYRNIVDRYPVIPRYLARRLAQANCDRAERLRHEKERLQIENEIRNEIDRLRNESIERIKARRVRRVLNKGTEKTRQTVKRQPDFEERRTFSTIRCRKRQVQMLQGIIDQYKMDGYVILDFSDISKRGFTSRAQKLAFLKFWRRRVLPSRYLKIEDMEREVRLLKAELQHDQLQNRFPNIITDATDSVDEGVSRRPLSGNSTFPSTQPSLVQEGAKFWPMNPPSENLCMNQPSSAWASSIDETMASTLSHPLRPSSPIWPSSTQEDANDHSRRPFQSQQLSQNRDGLPLNHAPSLSSLSSQFAVPATTSPPLVEDCTPQPPVDFWTRGRQSSRPASVHSRSSSMNSSLHGRPAFDPQEQNPTFITKLPASTTSRTGPSPALPPAPVELGKVTTFNCDICGQKIEVKRRLEWQ